MKRILIAFSFLWLGLAGVAHAAMSPDEVVRQTTDEILTRFMEDREALEKDSERLYEMVNEIVLPHFDMQRMARYVLGQHWSEASEEEQKAFAEEFKTQLVRTYATALFEYSGEQEIEYKPSRHEEGDKQAVVKSEIVRDDGPSIPVEYRLIRNDDKWQVYDVAIENISTVQNYRAQYGAVANSRGVSGLIDALKEKNEKLREQSLSEAQ